MIRTFKDNEVVPTKLECTGPDRLKQWEYWRGWNIAEGIYTSSNTITKVEHQVQEGALKKEALGGFNGEGIAMKPRWRLHYNRDPLPNLILHNKTLQRKRRGAFLTRNDLAMEQSMMSSSALKELLEKNS